LFAVLPKEAADYVTFHVDTIACRYCAASIADLKSQQAAHDADVTHRRNRYFQSSIGHLRKK
jgi:hypothetical protein